MRERSALEIPIPVSWSVELDLALRHRVDLNLQEDFNDIYNKIVFKWIFGPNVIFTRVPLKKIPQGIGPNGFNSAGTIITAGLPVQSNFYNFTTPDRKARRINSTEQFRNELFICAALSLSVTPQQWFTYMVGIFYSNL